MRNIDIKAGKLFCLSSGQYSDYGYNGHFLALGDINRETLDKVKASIESRKYDWEKHEKFISALIRSGLVMVIDCDEIHIGSYGELDY